MLQLAPDDRSLKPIGFEDRIDGQREFMAAISAVRVALCSRAHRLDPENWEDLLQDTLVKAWRARASYQPGTNLKAWLLTILRNCFLSGIAQNRRRVPWADHFVDRVVQPPQQETALLEQELTAAIAALGAGQRAALAAIMDDQLSYADAAKRLGVSLATLKSRVFRARSAVMASIQHGDPRRSRPHTSLMRLELL